MREIVPSKLATLIQKKFDGEVSFSGIVRGYVPRSEDTSLDDFYHSEGDHVLRYLTIGESGIECFRLYNRDGGYFSFDVLKKGKVSHTNPSKYGDIITIPITLHGNAVLQIEPARNSKIMY